MLRRKYMGSDYRKWQPLVLIGLLAFAIIVTGAGLGFVTASIQTMPSLHGGIKPNTSSQIYDINGKLIATIHATENRLPVSLSKMPKHLQDAFIASEDIRFYQHYGVDLRGIFRAIIVNISGKGVHEGASTITQQLARNSLLTHDKTLKRKVQEALLALQIERKYTKQEILEMYLNQIYFGQGAYGVQTAAQTYFGKNTENLTLEEAAMLAGIPRSPNYYSPANNMKAAKAIQETVLEQMVKYEYITASEAQKAKNTEIKLAKSEKSDEQFASYFVDYVTQILVARYGASAVYKEGLQIYTTLDSEAQVAAERAISMLPTYRTDKDGIKQPQGALVAVEPQTGYIKAMVGGRGNDQFNRAVLAERQPGSAFKPFVYLAALENGFTAATVVDDSPVTFGGWQPGNYDGKFRGPMTIREALEKSINTVAVKTAQQVGINSILNYAQQMGITTLVRSGPINDTNLSTALGGLTNGVIPLQMASAFGTIANQGIYAEPMAIVKVVDRNGAVLEQQIPKQKAVINEKVAYVLTDMMRGVMDRGTGTGANIGRPAAGKTGTTSDYVDAWFVGFTPDLACAVWLGLDSGGSLSGITGGDLPATMWRHFMSEALAKVPAKNFPRPNGIVSAKINPLTGLLASKDDNSQNATKPEDKSEDKPADTQPGGKSAEKPKAKMRDEIFIQGTQPTQYSPPETSANSAASPENQTETNQSSQPATGKPSLIPKNTPAGSNTPAKPSNRPLPTDEPKDKNDN